MYYRRKVILALLQQFGGYLHRTDFQKLLFLFSQKQEVPSFDFLPYKYGCFSWQANQDLSTMTKYCQIADINSGWNVLDKEDYSKQLKMKDRIDLVQTYSKFKDLRGEPLIRYVYENFPYYAVNSEIAKSILNEDHYNQVLDLKPVKNAYTLFTIGYEGKSVEAYVNLLIKEDLKVLCDVRKNPVSMKYGFSKNQLKNIVENAGIQYIHFPELGIDSDKRQELKSAKDYSDLFDDYELNTLPQQQTAIDEVFGIFLKSKRIALTCFEADVNQCHRSRVSKALAHKFDHKYDVEHM